MQQKHNQFERNIKKTGYKDGFTKVGFVLDSLDANQIAYTCIDSINKWSDENFGLSFTLFYRKNYLPSIDPKCPRYHVKDIMAFDGHLISTSIESSIAMQDAVKAKWYYYIYDLDWKRQDRNLSPDAVNKILSSNKITRFTRSPDFVDELKLAGCSSLNGDVKDFDINNILEIINAG